MPNDIVNKHITDKYFSFFDNIDNDLLLKWFKNMSKIVMICENKENKEFFNLMQQYFKTISTWFIKLEQIEWRTKRDILYTFRK